MSIWIPPFVLVCRRLANLFTLCHREFFSGQKLNFFIAHLHRRWFSFNEKSCRRFLPDTILSYAMLSLPQLLT